MIFRGRHAAEEHDMQDGPTELELLEMEGEFDDFRRSLEPWQELFLAELGATEIASIRKCMINDEDLPF